MAPYINVMDSKIINVLMEVYKNGSVSFVQENLISVKNTKEGTGAVVSSIHFCSLTLASVTS